VRDVDGEAFRWYEGLMTIRNLSPGTAVRHFSVMHHMMEKASTIWSKETGIDRNPADQVEVMGPDDRRDPICPKRSFQGSNAHWMRSSIVRVPRAINRTFYRLRLIVLIALTTGMRMAEIFGLRWETRCTTRDCWR
jgi:integrase